MHSGGVERTGVARQAVENQEKLPEYSRLVSLFNCGSRTRTVRGRMPRMTTYAIVRCKRFPSHIIRLAVVTAGRTVWAVFRHFDAECPDCKATQRFEGQHIRELEGPPPDETFKTHPAFMSVS